MDIGGVGKAALLGTHDKVLNLREQMKERSKTQAHTAILRQGK
jgi:hypothetical protein